MSYLSALRLHFSGQFQTNVSTVNNDAFHFNNAAFKPEYQKMQGPHMSPPNGWFNPEGDAAFRLLGCQIKSAWMPSGEVTASDPILSYIVADSDEAVPAKMVDLDPEQQLVSEIWGLTVRIANAKGDTVMSGQFEPAAFIDIWGRATEKGGGDTNASAMWQSVITDLHWGEVSGSPFLMALKEAASDGLLSIKFNCDGINMSYGSDDFMCGRITGSIGPATAEEPKHLILGRHFMASNTPKNQGFFDPVGGINFFAAHINHDDSCVYLDLGNALPTTIPGGPLASLGDMNLSVYDPLLSPDTPAGQLLQLGTLDQATYTDPDWYGNTAGVVAIPLSEKQLEFAAAHPLVLSNSASTSIISEPPLGAFVRADKFVYRMSPGDTEDIPVFATQYGVPFSDQKISFVQDASQLQPTPDTFPFAGASPPVAVPVDGVTFADEAMTDVDGKAILTVTAGDPGKARWFNNQQDYGIDGQVYGIRPAFVDSSLDDGPVNISNFVSFLIWSHYDVPEHVTWTDIHPIFQQYANLYPVMNRFLNLGELASVNENLWLLKLAFSLPVSDPNAMPVTRDLSPAKRQAILTWLNNPLPGSTEAADKARELALSAAEAQPAVPNGTPQSGGKSAAIARRLSVQEIVGAKS